MSQAYDYPAPRQMVRNSLTLSFSYLILRFVGAGFPERTAGPGRWKSPRSGCEEGQIPRVAVNPASQEDRGIAGALATEPLALSSG